MKNRPIKMMSKIKGAPSDRHDEIHHCEPDAVTEFRGFPDSPRDLSRRGEPTTIPEGCQPVAGG